MPFNYNPACCTEKMLRYWSWFRSADRAPLQGRQDDDVYVCLLHLHYVCHFCSTLSRQKHGEDICIPCVTSGHIFPLAIDSLNSSLGHGRFNRQVRANAKQYRPHIFVAPDSPRVLSVVLFVFVASDLDRAAADFSLDRVNNFPVSAGCAHFYNAHAEREIDATFAIEKPGEPSVKFGLAHFAKHIGIIHVAIVSRMVPVNLAKAIISAQM